MHWVGEAIVRDGKVVLTDLPFADGQHVDVIVDKLGVGETAKQMTANQIQTLFREDVKREDGPDGVLPGGT